MPFAGVTIIRYARPSGGMGLTVDALNRFFCERFETSIEQLYWLSSGCRHREPFEQRLGGSSVNFRPLSTGDNRAGKTPVANPFRQGEWKRWVEYLGSFWATLLYGPWLLEVGCRLPLAGPQARRIRNFVDHFTPALKQVVTRHRDRRLLFINHEPHSLESLCISHVVHRLGIPIGLMHHGGPNHARVLQMALMRRLARATGAVFPEPLREQLGPDHFDLLQGVDTDWFSPQQVEQNKAICSQAREGALLFIAPGRLIPAKGYLDLVKAAALVKARTVRDFQILLVGPAPSERYRDELESMVNRLGLEDHVLILAPQPLNILRQLYAQAHVGISASHAEAVPRVVMEMASMQLPVVATRVGGSSRTVVNGETGFLVPPRQPESLARPMLLLLQDTHLRRRLGRAAREHIKQNLCFSKLVANHVEFHRKVLEG